MKWKMNACDFFKKWYSENKNNIAGKQVNEVYYTYRAQAIKENSRPYSKKYFICEVKYELGYFTRECFFKSKDIYYPDLKEEDEDE